MQHRFHIIKWLFALWMLCSIITPVRAVSPVQAPTAWRTTPTLSSDITLGYQFRSTSTYAPVVGATSYTTATVYAPCSSAPSSQPRRAGEYNPWEDSGDPTGQQIGQVDTPLGEPFILLLLAGLFVLYKKRRTA